eukprot:3571402-Alexandrium_andersonii.AAC.1
MSASLVGSEMCIRDRRREGWASMSDRVCFHRNVSDACTNIKHGGMWEGAVSYTHLTLPTICSV